jgi:hypothetical protein
MYFSFPFLFANASKRVCTPGAMFDSFLPLAEPLSFERFAEPTSPGLKPPVAPDLKLPVALGLYHDYLRLSSFFVFFI